MKLVIIHPSIHRMILINPRGMPLGTHPSLRTLQRFNRPCRTVTSFPQVGQGDEKKQRVATHVEHACVRALSSGGIGLSLSLASADPSSSPALRLSLNIADAYHVLVRRCSFVPARSRLPDDAELRCRLRSIRCAAGSVTSEQEKGGA